MSQAVSTAHGVLDQVAGLASARVVRRLHKLRRAADPHTPAVPAAADFAEAYDEVFVA